MKQESVDAHMHLEYGPLSKEYVFQFVEEAVKKGMNEIRILDHTHRFRDFEQCYEPLKKYEEQRVWLENKQMKFKDSLDDYSALINECRKENFPVNVKFGLEVCYTPESENMLKSILGGLRFDFLVGAIHSIDGILYDMNFSEKLLWKKRDTDEIYRRYYELLIQCVKSNLFTQLAHPDTVKMFGYYPHYDLKPTYELLASELKKNGMSAECNTGCHYRYNHPDIGLSDELLKVFIEKDVPVITASDAHHPEDVGTCIKEAQARINAFKGEL